MSKFAVKLPLDGNWLFNFCAIDWHPKTPNHGHSGYL